MEREATWLTMSSIKAQTMFMVCLYEEKLKTITNPHLPSTSCTLLHSPKPKTTLHLRTTTTCSRPQIALNLSLSSLHDFTILNTIRTLNINLLIDFTLHGRHKYKVSSSKTNTSKYSIHSKRLVNPKWNSS